MSGLRLIYLLLAIAGALIPAWHFLAMLQNTGPEQAAASGLWPSILSDPLTSQAIAAFALTIWILAETWVRRNWLALIAIPATFAIGLGCGLPLYLFLRTAPVR